jgi:hypothetical protein
LRWQGRYVETVVFGSIDLVKFFIDIKMPGVCAEAARLTVGVNQGDASVIAQAVQAAVAPSAGQQALQAGEGVPVHEGVPVFEPPTNHFAQLVGFMTDLRKHMESQSVVNGAESTVRMQNLVVATRHKCLVKGDKRRIGPYLRTTWSLPQKTWTQTELGRWLRE